MGPCVTSCDAYALRSVGAPRPATGRYALSLHDALPICLARAGSGARVPGGRAGHRERPVSDLARAAAHPERVDATVMAVNRAARQKVAPIVDSGRCRSQKRGTLIMSNAESRGRFIWHELLTTDTAAAAAFYPKVLPWRTQPSSMPGYNLWMAGQTQIGGLMALPPEAAGTPPHWLIYVGTPSVDASCSQAQGLGAKVLKAPRSEERRVGKEWRYRQATGEWET